MKLILKKAKIIDKRWKKKGRFDLAIKNGKIEKIAPTITIDGYKEIQSPNLHVSIGFLDIGTQVGEPGLEHRENLDSIIAAAASGGFTAIAPFPNTEPVIHSKTEILFLKNNTNNTSVDFYPIGAISKNCAGEDITEMIDMSRNGAIAFSDGKKTIQNSGLMLRALQYAKACNGLIINHPNDKDISTQGQVHEGSISVSLGLEGIPEMAEIVALNRDIQLTQYAESKYCAHNISSLHTVKVLRKEKNSVGHNILSTVSYLNLIFKDKDVESFDVNLKVLPPLRDEKDRRSLIKGIKDDTIDAITSGHVPLEEELKKMSFGYASFGAIGIETTFSAMTTLLDDELDLETIIDKLSVGPRNILGLTVPEISEGENANLCIFDPDLMWTYKSETIKSRSKNSPFIDHVFKGKVLGIINNNKYISQ